MIDRCHANDREGLATWKFAMVSSCWKYNFINDPLGWRSKHINIQIVVYIVCDYAKTTEKWIFHWPWPLSTWYTGWWTTGKRCLIWRNDGWWIVSTRLTKRGRHLGGFLISPNHCNQPSPPIMYKNPKISTRPWQQPQLFPGWTSHHYETNHVQYPSVKNHSHNNIIIY